MWVVGVFWGGKVQVNALSIDSRLVKLYPRSHKSHQVLQYIGGSSYYEIKEDAGLAPINLPLFDNSRSYAVNNVFADDSSLEYLIISVFYRQKTLNFINLFMKLFHPIKELKWHGTYLYTSKLYKK